MIYSLLVTGTGVWDFHLDLCMRLNSINRREQTVLYTCFEDDLSDAIACAERCGLTLQKIVHIDGAETYPILVQGESPGWKPMTQED